MRFAEGLDLSSVRADRLRSPAIHRETELRAVYGRFRPLLEALGWHEVRPGEALRISDLGDAVVVGIVLWRIRDLAWLDALAEAAEFRGLSTFVANVDVFGTHLKLQEAIPGIPNEPILDTPLLYRFKNGKAIETLRGLPALQRLIVTLG